MEDADPRAAYSGGNAAGGDANTQFGLAAVAQHQQQQLAEAPSQNAPAAAAKRRYLTDTSPGLAGDTLAKVGMATQLGDTIRQIHTANALEATLAPLHGAGLGSAGYQAIRDQALRDSGSPTDPIEEMLIEQFVLCNYHLGQLHVRAAQGKSSEAAKVFYTALARMQAESRKLALALQAYRTPPKTSQFMVIKQANLAAGDQQVAFLDQTKTSPGNICNHDNQLIPAQREGVPQAIENQAENCQPATRRGRPRKQPKA